jgi:hypothetical protein
MSSIRAHEKSITFNPYDARLEIIGMSSSSSHDTAIAAAKNKPKIPEKQKPKFDWNDLDMKAYLDIGAGENIPYGMWRQENRFLREVDISKGPIVRAVTAMVRLKAPDYSSSNPSEKHERKEWLYYLEKWEGVDWRGVPVNPVREHFQGVYTKQFTRPVYGERGDIIDYKLDPTKAQKTYLIPFSKKAVDDIIAKYPGTDKDDIVYTVKFDIADSFAGNTARSSRQQFRYEQFVSKWEDVYKIHTMPPAEIWDKYIRTKGKTADSLNFEPT